MMKPEGSQSEQVLILAPTGRDAQVIAEVLASASITSAACKSMRDLVAQASVSVGAIVLAEEALKDTSLRTLVDSLGRQSSWSDIPIIVATAKGSADEALMRALQALEVSGNVTVLERPAGRATMILAVRAALRARRRQYEVRNLLVEREARNAELEAEKNARERFVSVLAHDLRGPLSTAKMAIQLLLSSADSMERRVDLKLRVDRSLERIEAMIRNLLDANRIEAGERLPLRIDECDLAAIAREVVDEINLAEPGRIVVTGDERARGFWSAEELRRSVWNLTTNAFKYGAKDIPIEVGVRSSGDRVELSVHNGGRAIPIEEQARLFEPYRRAQEGHAGQPRGWGLGLTLVRGCAEAHGGSVRVKSDAAEGTTFTLTLPRDSRPYQSLPSRPEAAPADDEEGAPPHSVH